MLTTKPQMITMNGGNSNAAQQITLVHLVTY